MRDSFHSRISSGTTDTRVKAEYGYIVDIIAPSPEEDNQYYIAEVAKENSALPSDIYTAIVHMEQTPQELASLYGTPRDLIGLRVRIDYTGNDFRSGVARVVSGRAPTAMGGFTEVRSRGFRHARPGTQGGGFSL
jgi:hypothetical protein